MYYLISMATLAFGLSPPLNNHAFYWVFTLSQSLVHVLRSVIFTMKGEDFALDETEAQRAYVICLRSHS